VIAYHVGDATKPDLDGPYIIAHVLSDTGAYGAGFAAAIAQRCPEARTAFQEWPSSNLRLGQIHVAPIEAGWVANMVAQHGLRSPTNRHPLDLSALTLCLRQVAAFGVDQVAMPRIGCGLAGGTWAEVEPVVATALSDVDVHVYDIASRT
jgi:O-acetyl-ADP-ribose deacetylase (regulator of RNase III)